MQNYAQIDDIDHYSLHNIFIISVITEQSFAIENKFLSRTEFLHVKIVKYFQSSTYAYL